jgi:diguanylate cyclase (GGDEF)-like protein
LRKIILPGLVLYTLSSGLGLFLNPDPSGLLLTVWLSGYLLLALSVAYASLFFHSFTRDVHHRLPLFSPFYFIILGIILLNFFVQITGGVHSTLWPGYFLFAVLVAAFSPVWQTYATTCLIVAIEAANLFISRQWEAEKWPVYAGFGVALISVSAVISHIMHRTRGEKKQAEDKLEKLIEHADAIDPLADSDTIEALTEENQLASNVKAARNREDAFSGLIDMIYEFVPAHAYALFLKERVGEGDAFVLRARRSDSDGMYLAPIGEVLKPEQDNGVLSGCIKYTQPQYLSNMEQTAGTLGYYTRRLPVKSVLVIPIVHNDDNIGVLAVDSLEGGAFSFETQDLLARFTPFFIQIIEKIRVSQELNLRATTFAAMHDISTVLNSSLELDRILERLAKEINVLVPHEFCVFVQYDDKNRTIAVGHQSGSVTFTGPRQSLVGKISSAVKSLGSENTPEYPNKPFPLEQGSLINQMLGQWEQRQSAPYHFFDLNERETVGLLDTTSGLSQQLRSLSCWPLATGEKFVGAFFLGSLRAHAFSDFHRNFLDTLTNQVALVMDNAILHQQISNLARTDGLTGLLNHRTFMEKLAEEYKRLNREPRPFSILLMDIDKFKNVNDKYGHPVGDVAIKAVAKVMKDAARSSDFVARYGGEEFAVGMVDTDCKGAEQMGERIRKVLEKTLVTRVFDGELRITVSIGVSSFPLDTKNAADLVTMADMALYQAKRSGRNRVCLFRDVQDREPAATKP